MPKQSFPATCEALSTARLATITSLKTLLIQPKKYVGRAEGSMKWRRNLERLSKGGN